MTSAPTSPSRRKPNLSCESSLPEEPPGTAADLAEIVGMVLGTRAAVASALAETVTGVEGRVRHLAADVLSEIRESKHSSSSVDAMNQLHDIRRLCLELQRKLGGMDDVTRLLLISQLEWMQRPIRLTGKRPAPVPAAEVAVTLISSPDSVPPLKALAHAAEATRTYINGRATTALSPGAKQGAGNLRKRLAGDVRVHLAKECAKLIGAGQGPRSITGTESGKLHRLVAALWTYATGLDSDEGGSSEMVKIVKRVAPEVRAIVQQRQQLGDASALDARGADLVYSEWQMDDRLRRRSPAATPKPPSQGSKR